MEYEDLQRLSGHFCNLGEDELRHFTPYIFPCKVSSQEFCTGHLHVTNIRYRQFHMQEIFILRQYKAVRLIFSLAKFHPKNFAQDTYMLQISGIGNFICRKYLYSVSTKQYYSNICNAIVPDIVESLS